MACLFFFLSLYFKFELFIGFDCVVLELSRKSLALRKSSHLSSVRNCGDNLFNAIYNNHRKKKDKKRYENASNCFILDDVLLLALAWKLPNCSARRHYHFRSHQTSNQAAYQTAYQSANQSANHGPYQSANHGPYQSTNFPSNRNTFINSYSFSDRSSDICANHSSNRNTFWRPY
jgi:hypothetical protein